MVSPGLPVWCHLAQASCSIAARGGPRDSLGLMHMSLVGGWVCVCVCVCVCTRCQAVPSRADPGTPRCPQDTQLWSRHPQEAPGAHATDPYSVCGSITVEPRGQACPPAASPWSLDRHPPTSHRSPPVRHQEPIQMTKATRHQKALPPHREGLVWSGE